MIDLSFIQCVNKNRSTIIRYLENNLRQLTTITYGLRTAYNNHYTLEWYPA